MSNKIKFRLVNNSKCSYWGAVLPSILTEEDWLNLKKVVQSLHTIIGKNYGFDSYDLSERIHMLSVTAGSKYLYLGSGIDKSVYAISPNLVIKVQNTKHNPTGEYNQLYDEVFNWTKNLRSSCYKVNKLFVPIIGYALSKPDDSIFYSIQLRGARVPRKRKLVDESVLRSTPMYCDVDEFHRKDQIVKVKDCYYICDYGL